MLFVIQTHKECLYVYGEMCFKDVCSRRVRGSKLSINQCEYVLDGVTRYIRVESGNVDGSIAATQLKCTRFNSVLGLLFL